MAVRCGVVVAAWQHPVHQDQVLVLGRAVVNGAQHVNILMKFIDLLANMAAEAVVRHCGTKAIEWMRRVSRATLFTDLTCIFA